MVSLSDAEDNDGGDSVLGDVLALVAALLYACYLVFIRWRTGEKVGL